MKNLSTILNLFISACFVMVASHASGQAGS